MNVKHIRSCAILLLVAVTMTVSFLTARAERAKIDDAILIHVIDVGQADCMVIETPNGNVMIDTGTDLSESTLRAYLRSHGLTSFEYLILSHPHDDHIGGADMILREFSVRTLVSADTVSTDQVWLNVKSALAERQDTVQWMNPTAGTVFWIDEVRFHVLAVPTAENKGENDDSLIVRADIGDCSVLMMGDAEAKAETYLLETVPPSSLQATFLKVGHHGSSGSTTEDFLNVVSPEIAVISAGEGNSFSHPHEELLTRLRSIGTQIYRTDMYGTHVFSCDGNTISLLSPNIP